MTDAFIGEIRMLPYGYAPVDWAWCDGQLIAIAQNQALFAIIGGTYGGDWRVSMGLPNLKDRTPIGEGQGIGLTNWTLGERGGAAIVTLLHNNLPSHTHTVSGAKKGASSGEPGPTMFMGSTKNTTQGPFYAYTAGAGAPTVDTAPQALATAGHTQAHENRQPFLGVHFCIALEGVFPSRN